MEMLDDPERAFASSAFIRLEVLPKALFHRNQDEAAFYEAFFAEVDHWAVPTPGLLDQALKEATRSGLSALDALHIAAALSIEADELVTTERVGKPIHRVTAVPVRTIHPA
jgi:predicted nucleic acid-binding protein